MILSPAADSERAFSFIRLNERQSQAAAVAA